MKKIVLSTMAMAAMASMSMYGQGYMYFDGGNNTNPSSTATSSGLVFINGVLDSTQDVNAELLGGSSAGSLAPLAILLLSDQGSATASGLTDQTEPAANDINGWVVTPGTITDQAGNEYSVNNVATGSADIEVELWTGAFSTYAAAVTGGADTAISGIFTEAVLVGDQNEGPNQGDLENMPAMNMTVTATPEPTTLAFAGLGGLSLLLFRRRS